MIKSLEESGESAGTEAKSAILHGLSVTGRLEEALDLYGAFKTENVLPHSYAVGSLLVREFVYLYMYIIVLLSWMVHVTNRIHTIS